MSKELAESASESSIDLTVDVAGPVVVPCSVGVFTSIVQNLVRNAIKYMGTSTERRITVRLQRIDGLAHVEVADTGPGIPLELQPRIFDPFVRGAHDGVHGNGLGLATIKRLVESHRGQVGFTSSPGNGCLFWVDLPVTLPPSHTEGPSTAA
jgi:signal transduction histidine kinase